MLHRECLLAALMAGAMGVGAAAQTAAPPAATPALGGVSSARSQVEALRIQLAAARSTAETASARVQAGVAPAPEAEQALERVKVLEVALKDAEARLQREDRLLALQRPLNLRLTDASLRQAAIALSEAAGMPVVVDEEVGSDKRLTLEARGVSLGLLLETLADRADLMITPGAEGVRMRKWPVLQVDGRTVIRRSPMAPWSDEWVRYVETRPLPFGGPFGGVDAAQEVVVQEPVLPSPPAAPVPPRAAPGTPFRFELAPRAFAFGAAGGPISLAPVGDRNVVVAEPGVGERNERGYWLTVYRLDGEKLRKLSSTFHPSQSQGGGAAGYYFQGVQPSIALPRADFPPLNRLYVKPALPVPSAPSATPVPPKKVQPAPAPPK